MSDHSSRLPPGEMLGWIDGDSSESTEPQDASRVGLQLAVHGLLTQLHEDPGAAERRIAATLTRFNSERLLISNASGGRVARSRVRRLSGLAIPTTALSIAAAFALLFLWSITPPVTAEAAIAEAIAAIESPVTRVYDVVVRYRRGGFALDRRVKLYSQSTDNFVVSFRDSPIQPAAAGAKGDNQWLVFGESTWSSADGEESLGAMRARRALTRQLTLNGLLVELPRDYDLELLGPQPLPGSPGVECRPVRATARPGRGARARSVLVWPHPETGVVQRMEVEFDGGGRRRAESLTATLVRESPMDPAFFDVAAHTEPKG